MQRASEQQRRNATWLSAGNAMQTGLVTVSLASFSLPDAGIHTPSVHELQLLCNSEGAPLMEKDRPLSTGSRSGR